MLRGRPRRGAVVLGVAAVVLAITGDVLISTHAGQAAISLTLAGVAMLVAVIVNRRARD